VPLLLLAKNEKISKMANRSVKIVSLNRKRKAYIMKLIPRNSYMEKIINVIGTPDLMCYEIQTQNNKPVAGFSRLQAFIMLCNGSKRES